MTEFYTSKKIDNSRLLRPKAPGRWRALCRRLLLGGVIAAGGLLYAWQHFMCIQLRYELAELQAERSRVAELNQQLRLQVASLRSPMRIDAIARERLGLSVPVPGQVAPAQGPSDAVLAQARALGSGASQ